MILMAVPPPAPALEAKAESPNKIMVRWKRPFARQLNVAGYTLYIHEHGTGKVIGYPPIPKAERERERGISNSKTLFYKDCSLGLVLDKNLSNH